MKGMEKEIKLVICDIDNTLVIKHQDLSERARKVIDRLRQQGVYFGIASGRSLEEIRRILQRWGYDDMDVLICLNGSLLWDGIARQEHSYFKLKKDWIREIIDTMSAFQSNPVIYRDDTILCQCIDPIVSMSAASAQMPAYEVEDRSVFYEEENAKIMFRVDPKDMEAIEQYLSLRPSKKYHYFKTQSTLMEFSDRRVSKAYALKEFCDCHDIALSQVMAFGDTTNDNQMLAVSGIGVCMRNGSEDTKAIADVITKIPCDEDGWAIHMENAFPWHKDERV